MTVESYGSQSRRPVVYRGERIAGLYERQDASGAVVYELRRKVSGRMVRRTLEAQTPTDAIREARAAATRIEDGARLVGRSTVTLRELRDAFEEWATGRSSTLAESTRGLYLLRLDRHVLPALGSSTRAQDVTPAHLRAMVDKLSAAGQSGSSVRGAIVATSALFRHASAVESSRRTPCGCLSVATGRPGSAGRSPATSTGPRSTSCGRPGRRDAARGGHDGIRGAPGERGAGAAAA